MLFLANLKTAIRFLRHNREVLPGDWNRIISTGYSAGGAMSTLLAVTGDNDCYTLYLKANGAFMEESDAIYAAQIYCPIVDLEHADTSFSVSMKLALKLQNAGCNVDYALVWDQPHGEADYPGDLIAWIDSI